LAGPKERGRGGIFPSVPFSSEYFHFTPQIRRVGRGGPLHGSAFLSARNPSAPLVSVHLIRIMCCHQPKGGLARTGTTEGIARNLTLSSSSNLPAPVPRAAELASSTASDHNGARQAIRTGAAEPWNLSVRSRRRRAPSVPIPLGGRLGVYRRSVRTWREGIGSNLLVMSPDLLGCFKCREQSRPNPAPYSASGSCGFLSLRHSVALV
jgi:hypothetical protein